MKRYFPNSMSLLSEVTAKAIFDCAFEFFHEFSVSFLYNIVFFDNRISGCRCHCFTSPVLG